MLRSDFFPSPTGTRPMETPLQVTLRDFPHSEALEAGIRDAARKLEEFHSRIISCRVTVEELVKRRTKSRQYRVKVDLRIPGKEIVVDRDHDKDVYVALSDAMHAARRQLEDAARVMRGDVKGRAQQESGGSGS
jgi:ribosomal subunit interface protein